LIFSYPKSQKVLLNNQYLKKYLSNRVKDFLTGLIEQMIEEEFIEHIKRKKYERISETTGVRQYRNGYRTRHYLTRFCVTMQIKIPRCREGKYIPMLFRNKGILDTELEDILIHQWSEGNSYRDIRNFVEKVYGEKISLGLMHRMIKKIDNYVREYHSKKVENEYDSIYIDGLEICVKDQPPSLKNRYGNRRYVRIGKNTVLLGVLGQRKEGKKIVREMLDYKFSRTENTESYVELLWNLKKRGLSSDKFKLAVHDGEESISKAIKIVYGKEKVAEQECMFHKLLNMTKLVKDDRNGEEIRRDIWSVYNAKDLQVYEEKEKQVIEKWKIKEPEVISLFKKSNERLKTKYNFDEKMHKSIHTNNPIERYFRELRRRIKALGIFENMESADRLIFLMVESINQKRGSLPTNSNLKFTH
jgi:putative transposase